MDYFECFQYIDQTGRALDDYLNEFRTEEGACIYVPRELWNQFKQISL